MALTPSATRLLEVVVLAVVYYVAGRLGQFLAIPPGNVTAVWAPSGIALAAVLLYGNRVWPGIWLGSFFGNTWAFFDPTNNWTVVTSSAVGASIGMGATLEALAGKFFLQRLGISHSPLDRARDFLKFVGLAGVIGCTVSATIGVTSLCLGGFASWENYAWTWGTWWLGDTAGVLMVTPLILAWNSESLRGWTARKTTEAVLLLGLTIVLMPIAFGNVLMAGAFHAPLQFIVLPLLVWSAFRFGQLGATTLIGVIAVGGIWATAHGVGPFVRDSVNESLLLTQAFMGVYTVTLLAMTAVITERKQAEEALRWSEERFRLIVNNAHDAIFYIDLTGVIQWTSHQAVVISGRSMEEMVGRSFMTGLTPESAARAEARLAAIRRGESVPPLAEFEVLRPDGSAVWVEANFASVLEDGKVVGRLLVARDITERKRAEEKFRRVVESAPNVILLVNQKGTITLVNAQAERLFGYAREELLGQPIETLVPARFRGIHPGHRVTFFADPRIRDMGTVRDLYGLHKDGREIPIEIGLNPFETEEGLMVMSSIIDITERKRMEEEREDLYKRLQESHKGLRTLSRRLLEAQEFERRRIARELHDETGQTLTSLLIEMRMLAEMPMREAVRKRVSELRKTVARAISEIKRLALGLHPSVLDDLGLETALRRLTEEFVHAYGLKVDLHMNGLDGNRPPLAVETILYRIAQEALTNVAKHAGDARVSILLQCSPSAAKVIIEDDGRGFDAQTVLTSAGRSNHMGLHGMRERAALLNGSVEIESTPGGGTTIYVQVPIGKGSA